MYLHFTLHFSLRFVLIQLVESGHIIFDWNYGKIMYTLMNVSLRSPNIDDINKLPECALGIISSARLSLRVLVLTALHRANGRSLESFALLYLARSM